MKKQILFVITKSNFGGAQRYVYELATGLSHTDFAITVAFGGAGLLKEKLEASEIETQEIRSFARDINIFNEIRSMFELAQIIREVKPDIVHLNSSKAGGSGAFVSRILGVPLIIFTAHGWAFREPRNIVWKSIVWFFSWLTALLVHKVILVSNHDFTHTHMPFVKNKLSVIHTAVSHIDFETREHARTILFPGEHPDFHSKDYWLVTIAELTQNKNIESAVRAIADYNSKNERKIFYTVIGDGELRAELEKIIEVCGAKTQIRLLGYVDNARSYLKAFDAFLLPSYKEGMPYALLEAGLAHLPVIVSRVGGIPEIVQDDVHGILIDPDDSRTITHALHTLLLNPEREKTLGEALGKKIETSFTQNEMLDATKMLYEHL